MPRITKKEKMRIEARKQADKIVKIEKPSFPYEEPGDEYLRFCDYLAENYAIKNFMARFVAAHLLDEGWYSCMVGNTKETQIGVFIEWA